MRFHTVAFAAACVLAFPATSQTIERVRLTDNDLNCTQIYAEVQQMDMLISLGANSAPAAPVQQPPAVQQQAAQGANPFGGFGFPGQAAAVPQAGGYTNQAAINQAQVRQMMLASNRPDVRAAANDPAMVAQAAAIMQNPQLAVSAQRAAAAGVNPAFIQSQLAAAGAAQQAAAAAGGAGYAPQAAAPAPATPAAGLGGLFGALANARGGTGGAQAASIFGALANAQTPQPQAAAPAAPAQQIQYAPIAAQPQQGGGANMALQAQGRKAHLTQLFLSKGCKVSDVQR